MGNESIIEKLGIQVLCLYEGENNDGSQFSYFDEDSVREKEGVFNELLESLIDLIIKDEIHQQNFGAGIISNVVRLKYKNIAIRASGNKFSWPEIKTLNISN